MNNERQKKTANADSALNPRNTPVQKRSEETCRLILETAAQLLAKVGLEGLNTNLLAEHAGVRIGTVYRYFPNKFAILSALVEQWVNLVKENHALLNELADPAKEWRDIIRAFIRAYTSAARRQPAFYAVRSAMRASPELRNIEKTTFHDLASIIAGALKKRGSDLNMERIMTQVEVFLMAGAAVFDLAWLKGKKNVALDAEIMEELHLLTISYLSNYFD